MGAPSFSPAFGERVGTIPGVTGPYYDSKGNVTNDGGHTYTWNGNWGNESGIDGKRLTFDALGRMVEMANGATYTQMLYGPSGDKLALMNGQTVKQAFIPLMGGAQAVYNSSGLAFYRHSDWLGTVRLDTTPTRTVYFDGAWAPFGEYYQGTGTSDRVFTGQTQDVAGGIYDFLFRQYNSSQGRWIAPDPAGMAAVDITNPQTWNRYAYLANNPLNAVDPLGLYDCMMKMWTANATTQAR